MEKWVYTLLRSLSTEEKFLIKYLLSHKTTLLEYG